MASKVRAFVMFGGIAKYIVIGRKFWVKWPASKWLRGSGGWTAGDSLCGQELTPAQAKELNAARLKAAKKRKGE